MKTSVKVKDKDVVNIKRVYTTLLRKDVWSGGGTVWVERHTIRHGTTSLRHPCRQAVDVGLGNSLDWETPKWLNKEC